MALLLLGRGLFITPGSSLILEGCVARFLHGSDRRDVAPGSFGPLARVLIAANSYLTFDCGSESMGNQARRAAGRVLCPIPPPKATRATTTLSLR